MFGLPAANGLFSQLAPLTLFLFPLKGFSNSSLPSSVRPSLTIARFFLRPASSTHSSLIRLLYPNECAFKKKKNKLKHPKPTRQQVRAPKPQLRSLIIQLPKYAILTESLKKSRCLFVFPHSSPLVCDAKCNDRNHIQPEPKPVLPASSLGKSCLAT